MVAAPFPGLKLYVPAPGMYNPAQGEDEKYFTSNALL